MFYYDEVLKDIGAIIDIDFRKHIRTLGEIKKIENDVYDVAFEIEINTGINISPVIKNRAQFEYWVDTLPYYRNVRDEGITIKINKKKMD